MLDKSVAWLPDLLLLEDFKGSWENYLAELYSFYSKDFLQHTTHLGKIPVWCRSNIKHEGKDLTFWHLISEGKEEEDRIPDLRRCERIRWPRVLIECNNKDVKIWRSYRPKGNQQEERIIIALDDFSYVVVLAKAKTGRGFILITAYCVATTHRQNKLRKECEDYLRTKKEGFAY